MQAQVVKTDQNQTVITSQQSLQSVQTLLRAGLGCITYLRNLLPSDNFSESYLTSSSPDTLPSQPSKSGSSFASTDSRPNVSGFKIMTVTRGFTEEADKLLDYMENGVFDALQKNYLRSFVFAVYLDDQDPNNIIESYTFNFNYYEVPGTKETIPVMTLGEEMNKLSLSAPSRAQDPVAEAMRKGKVPTLGEVKRSLKALIKNLIQATTQMDPLPKRRFATFKLFYYDNTPDEYEPPHFRPGDADRDKWFMTTHHKQEVPERCSVGFVHTGYHGVDVKVTSVSAYLPSGEDNNAPFLGTTERNVFAAPSLTPMEEAAIRAQQIETQRRDAAERRVIWNGDDNMGDVGRSNGGAGDIDIMPVGIRDDDGDIVPLSPVARGEESAMEAQYAGRPESIPVCIGQLAIVGAHPGQEVSPTQEIEDSPARPSLLTSVHSSPRSPTPTPKPRNSSCRHIGGDEFSLPPSDAVPSVSSSAEGPESIDTQYLKDMIMADMTAQEDDGVMLDMETQQIQGFSGTDEPIEPVDEVHTPVTDTPMEQDQLVDTPPDCECGVQLTDCDICCCDGGCERWFHLWCMGYHSAQDLRIPEKFICFDCRVRADRNWELIVVHDLYPRMIARFKDLAIQRRGIKVFENYVPPGLSAFAKLIGCDSTVAGQVFKWLETEGFIAQETREVDDTGLIETRMVSSKRKGRSGKMGPKPRTGLRRKNLQKPVYVFVETIKNEDVYQDHFNPDPEVEKRLLGLSDLRKASRSGENSVKEKKIKISLVPPVDLGD
ncbi:HORMA-domain-containing protein [Dichomitus squalens]|uniref:HORMA-domain-containing protein n=1 Tax=Dichomitus squalens TaxID=114155 RepID=A0A4Q9N4W3_9APHY|nr:HORMA-domain-containing protein [Dichomitus squalens]